VPLDIAVVMLVPLMSAMASIVARSSMIVKRHGWLFSCDGARPATSMSSRWCSSDTGSGRKGPFVVLRRRTTSRNSIYGLHALIRLARKNGAAESATAGCRRPRVPAYGMTASGTAAGSSSQPALLRLHSSELAAPAASVLVVMYMPWCTQRTRDVSISRVATAVPSRQFAA
jgi:hypothetical protein